MSEVISVNLIQGEQTCTTRMKQTFTECVSTHIQAGALKVTFDKKGYLTLSSHDMELLDKMDKKAQKMLGYVPSV